MDQGSLARRVGESRFRAGLPLLAAALAMGADEPSIRLGDPKPAPEAVRQTGREIFARVWVPNDRRSHGGDGLGPVFNAQSCLACHDQGGPGGSGGSERNIEIAAATAAGTQGYGFSYGFSMDFGAGRFEYRIGNEPPPSASTRRSPPLDREALARIHPGMRDSRSVMLHKFATDPTYQMARASVPGLHGTILVQMAQRNPTPLFGVGLIDAIPDEVIEAAAKRKTVSAKVKGRVSHPRGGGVGRFGWKGQTATLAEFSVSAAANEIGLEVPGHRQAADPRLPGIGASALDMNQAECDALVAYVRSLPRPVVNEPEDDKETAQARGGEATFKAIGCADCHLPRLGEVEGIYSDLLLHDMGPRLGDTGAYGVFVGAAAGDNGVADALGRRGETGVATPQEWRTPPLWGLRDSAPYLHDGRAETIAQAIALHGGQGAASAQRYSQLSPRRKQQLGSFLSSLAAPPREREPAAVARAESG